MGTDTATAGGKPILGLPTKKSEPAPTPDSTGPGSMASAEAQAEARAGLESRKRGPYNKPNRKGQPVAGIERAPTPPGTAIPPEIQAELERLFSPEIWEPIAELPGAAMMALTGHEHWDISEKERRVLSVSISTAAKYMGIRNPKWLAVNLALINLMTIYFPRALTELKIRAQQKQTKKAEP